MPSSPPQRYRRTVTVVWGGFVCGLVAVVGGLASSSQRGWALAAWILVTAAIVVVVGVTLIWPCVVLRDEDVTIRNSFIEYDVPYAAFDRIEATRIGVIARTHSGKKLPIAAYTSGSSGRRFKHPKSAESLLDAMELRRLQVQPDETATHASRLQVLNLVVTLAVVIAAVVVVWIAATR